MTKIFIDGSAGTTGLKIYERLSDRKDIEIITLNEAVRKNVYARREALNKADIAFLCLPDDAAREAVSLIENKNTAVIDTSTAHRTNDEWVYGFPELAGQKAKIETSKRIANPGCHASGFIALIAPLSQLGVLDRSEKLSAFSLTGYSGGGKKMIASYDDPDNKEALSAPRMYGLSQEHKHLPEMKKICALEYAPIFCPIVSSYYSGMEVTVTLFRSQLKCDPELLPQIYKEYYGGKIVKYSDESESGFLSAGTLSGRDDMIISVFGNEERITLVSRFDNLGKGASGAAIQNMNILMGLDEAEGLNIGGK